jgi:Rieske Fe-S protein
MSDANAFVSRRQFCAGACQLASCATVATLVSSCGGSPTAPSDSVSALGKLAGQFAGVFLVARTSANTFTALEGVCTHEGCTVTGAAGDVYVCPCHGSRYTRTGQVVQGPARSALRQYGTSFASDVLTITI